MIWKASCRVRVWEYEMFFFFLFCHWKKTAITVFRHSTEGFWDSIKCWMLNECQFHPQWVFMCLISQQLPSVARNNTFLVLHGSRLQKRLLKRLQLLSESFFVACWVQHPLHKLARRLSSNFPHSFEALSVWYDSGQLPSNWEVFNVVYELRA